ncbi:MAG: helix-turn-helix domain-containing protein [Microbacterium sp.]|uniref:helix-turn-helix domain-containing protein n=1 Tax=Microbacterium sp. TaxID=51671 RepID=UPI0039E4BF08
MEMPFASRYVDVLLEAVLDGGGLRGRDQLIQLLAAKAVDLVGCDMGAIRIPDAGGTALRVAAVHGIEGLTAEHAAGMRAEVIDLSDIRSSAVQPGPRSPSAEAFLGGTIQVVAEIANATRTGFTMRSMVAVPMISAGRTLGVLTLYWRRRHVLDDAEREGLVTIGHRLALALDIGARADALSGRSAQLADQLAQEAARGAEARTAVQVARGTLDALRADRADPLPAVLDAAGAATGATLTVRVEQGASGDAAPATDGWSAPLEVADATAQLVSDLPTPPSDTVAETVAAAVAVAFDRESRARADSAVSAGAALRRLCLGAPELAVQDAAAVLGLLRNPPLVLLVGECVDDVAAYRALRTLTRLPLGATVIAAADIERRVVVLCHDDGAAAGVAARMLALDGIGGVGVGERFDRRHLLREVLERASAAAHLSIARGAPVPASEVKGLADLAASLDPAEAARLVDDVLGPVRRYDADHRTELLATLRAFLDADGSAVVCGQRLHLHPNTVKQRVERIERLLGTSLRSYSSVARVSVAMSWHDLLRD